MDFTEQEWTYIEDLKSLDNKLAELIKEEGRDTPEYVEIETEFCRQLRGNFPSVEEIYVLLEVFPDVDEDHLYVTQVLEEVPNASVTSR